jgi:hypothetical protein
MTACQNLDEIKEKVASRGTMNTTDCGTYGDSDKHHNIPEGWEGEILSAYYRFMVTVTRNYGELSSPEDGKELLQPCWQHLADLGKEDDESSHSDDTEHSSDSDGWYR